MLQLPPLEEWAGIRSARFAVSRTAFHHHAAAQLRANPDIERAIRQAIDGIASVRAITRAGPRHGIKTDDFNESIRTNFRRLPDWNYEVIAQDGVLLGKEAAGTKIEGFDLARFDIEANLRRLWNACFGRRRLANGADWWNSVIGGRPAWTHRAEALRQSSAPGLDLKIEKTEPTVLGEVQCGNWALLYYDLLKLLAAHAQTEVDLYIYIAPDGQFSELISDATVTFKETEWALEQFQAALPVPIWIVGVDLVWVGSVLPPASS